jgi:hypothetical protein
MSLLMNAIDQLLAVASAFADARQLSDWRVSTLVFGEGTRLKHLREGGDMGARRVARGLTWFSANWPDGAEWPVEVSRPEASREAARC